MGIATVHNINAHLRIERGWDDNKTQGTPLIFNLICYCTIHEYISLMGGDLEQEGVGFFQGFPLYFILFVVLSHACIYME